MNKKHYTFILGVLLFSPLLNAQTWTPSKRITWTPNSTSGAQIAVDSSDILHFVYVDVPSGDKEIYYKRSSDGGTTWADTKRLTWNSGRSYGPILVVDSSNRLHLIWSDFTPGNFEIYHKKSNIGGTTWLGTKRILWTSGISEYPKATVDSGDDIHVVWTEIASTYRDILYKKGIQ